MCLWRVLDDRCCKPAVVQQNRLINDATINNKETVPRASMLKNEKWRPFRLASFRDERQEKKGSLLHIHRNSLSTGYRQRRNPCCTDGIRSTRPSNRPILKLHAVQYKVGSKKMPGRRRKEELTLYQHKILSQQFCL